MTIEELRNFLNTLVEENPESKDKEVKILYWEKDETFGNDEFIAYDPVLDAEYDADKKILLIEGETI